MTRLSWTAIAVAFVAALTLAGITSRPAQAAAPADGKAMFTQMKCNMCHTIESQGIAQIKEEGEEGDEDVKPKDLSNVGGERDAKWLKGWLEKKEMIDGKTHRKKFSGEPADLKVMADWLATLKKAAK